MKEEVTCHCVLITFTTTSLGLKRGRKILVLLVCQDKDKGISSLRADCLQTGTEIFLCSYESHTLGQNWTGPLYWEHPSVNTGFFKGRLKMKIHHLQDTVLNYHHWGHFLLLYVSLASTVCYWAHWFPSRYYSICSIILFCWCMLSGSAPPKHISCLKAGMLGPSSCRSTLSIEQCSMNDRLLKILLVHKLTLPGSQGSPWWQVIMLYQ